MTIEPTSVDLPDRPRHAGRFEARREPDGERKERPVDDDREQSDRQDRDRQRDQLEDRADDRVDQAETMAAMSTSTHEFM